MVSIFYSIVLLLSLTIQPEKINLDQNPLEVVIITGQNNHNWKASSKWVEKIFNNSDLFNATLIRTPIKGEDMSMFKPDFKKYDLICMDYSGDYWPQETQENFVDFIKNGGGLVLYHASDNAFPEWKEFNRIIGLGGWENRTERHGDILYWEKGKIKKDKTPGRGGVHGKQGQYIVYHRTPDHPILKGLPSSWLHTKDELYHSLRGPAEDLSVLATAQQSRATGGSGRQEPVLMTIKYGKGRIFHSVLGHVGKNSKNLEAIQCVGFVTTLLRGAEWAATGQVTQKIIGRFPDNNNTSLWAN